MQTPKQTHLVNSTILLVDDDPTLLRFLKDYLKGEGYSVFTASSGKDALHFLKTKYADLVVLDVMMPVMDGWETCARLREMASTPVIFLTAKTTEQDKIRGFQLGVDDYVTKPFSFAELSARIQAILARTQGSLRQQERRRLTHGDIILDLDKREAQLRGKKILLTPTEFRLMECLMRNRGRAVPEEELVRLIWGNFELQGGTAVRRYIWLLRQKFEEDPTTPRLIYTVRGYGYRLGGTTGALPPLPGTTS